MSREPLVTYRKDGPLAVLTRQNPPANACSLERELQAKLFSSDDAAEGLAAVGQKRAAQFEAR